MTKNASSYNRVLHYIPPVQKFSDLVQEYIEPTPSDNFIYWLYRYRCLVCKKHASEINEIVPRGRSKKSILDWKNRIPFCSECHMGDGGFHHNGVTIKKINEMKSLQKEYLISIGRGEYAKQLDVSK